MACGLDHSTVARRLRTLADEPDPMIVCLEKDRGLRGDLYELRIPDEAAGSAALRAWPGGKAHSLRPAFRELGPVAALAFESLENAKGPRSRFDVAASAHLSPSAAAEALRVLAEFGLAVQNRGRWRLGTASLTTIAQLLGVEERLEALIARYNAERAAWRALLGALPRGLSLDEHFWDAAITDPERDIGAHVEPDTPLELCARILGAHVIAQYASSVGEAHCEH